MTIFLWLLQFLLALHTATGAIWKFSHSAQTVPALKALPPAVWLGMGVVELVCSLALLLPLFLKIGGQLVGPAALVVAAEMVLFCGLHLRSGESQPGHLVYWLIVAALCALVAYGLLMSKPL